MKSKLLAITTAYTKALTKAGTGTVAKAITLAIAIALGIVATTYNANAQSVSLGNNGSQSTALSFTEDNSTLTLTGDYTIDVTTTTTVAGGGTVAIWVADGKTLTITGSGTLTLKASATDNDAAGLYIGPGASVTVNADVTLSAFGTTTWTGADALGAGVRNVGGTFTLNGGTLLIDGSHTGFYNSVGTGTTAAIVVNSGKVEKIGTGTAKVTNATLAATVNVGPNTDVNVDPGLHTAPYGNETDGWWFAPYFTITGDPIAQTADKGSQVTLDGTNLVASYNVPADNDGNPQTNPFGGVTFDNITHVIIGGTAIDATNLTFNTTSLAFNVPTSLADDTYNLQVRFQILGDASNKYYLTKNIGTITVTTPIVVIPTVTVTKGNTGVKEVSTVTESAGTYSFTVTPIVELNNGTFTLTKNGTTETVDANPTDDNNDGIYEFTLTNVTDDLDLVVAYTGTTTVQAGEGVTVDAFDAADSTFIATPTTADKTGIFAFTYSVDGNILTANTPTATVGTLDAGKYTVKLAGNIPTNLLVKVNYSIPAVDEPTVDEELPTITPDEISEENAGNAFILVGGKENDDKWTDSKIEPVVNSSKLVPGTTYTTKVTTTKQITTTEKLTISFTGALATVVPPIEVEKPTQVINPGEFAVIFVFQSSEAGVLKSKQARTVQLKDETTVAQSHAEYKNGILYIYLVGIKEDALGNQSSTAQLNLKEGNAAEVTVATVEGEITLYDHPLYLTINNTVPSTGFPGSFTLTGEYEIGSLWYRIGAENYKVFTGELLQSEIARLANGELLYLTLNYKDFNNVIVYVPNTFEGTSPSPIPQNRNVTVLLAKDGTTLIAGLTSNDEFKFTFTPDVSYEDGTVELTFTRDGLPVQNPPTVTGTEAPVDGTYNITLKNVKTSNLVVTLYYKTTTQNQIVTENKVWTDNNTLYIQTKNNGTAIVYDVNGKIVKTVTTKQGINSTQLNSGVYVVKTGKNVYKVVVK